MSSQVCDTAKMAIIQSILNVLAIVITFSKLSLCLYEDQIGKFDWRQSYVGKVKFASFDSVKRIIVATEENVIAAINIKNGQIAWRHVLENSPTATAKLLHVDKEIVTVTGEEDVFYVRGWELNNGVLLWEWCLHTEQQSAYSQWLIYKDKLIHLVPVVNSHLEITEYDLRSGQNRGATSRIAADWMQDLEKCTLGDSYWICISRGDSNGVIYYLNLATDVSRNKLYTENINTLMGVVPGDVVLMPFKYVEPAIMLVRNNVARIVTFNEDTTMIFSKSFSPNSFTIQNGDRTLILDLNVRKDKEKTLILKTTEADTDESVIEAEYLENLGDPEPIAGICRGNACRLLVATSDDALCLLQLPNGKILWKREESLSNIIGVEFVELPVSDLDASIEKEFATGSNNVLSMLYNRLLTQSKQLTTFLSGKQIANNKLVRDEFGLHKLILAMTKVGKLFAIDTLSGDIVWARLLNGITPFSTLSKERVLLLEQRNARYPPLTAEYALIATDAATGRGVLYRFDPISGNSKNGLEKLPYFIKQTMMIPFEDETHLRCLLIVSNDDQVYLYPEEARNSVLHHINSLYMYTINSQSSLLNGYSFKKNSHLVVPYPTWKLSLGQSKIVAVSVRPHIERVHSQGRVLADRSVLYKYVNPNLIAVATLNDDPLHKRVLSVYLIDGITGLVIYSTNHKRAKGPVHLVHSENWVVYSYYSERYRRVEMASIELYEGVRQSNSTAFSSHALSQLPQVETLACILPAAPLAMVATLTERGITNKHLLIALSNGAVNELPWIVLEPRGPHILPGPDEGSIPYMPELPLVSEATINYNQSLERVSGIAVSPARLESTTLVFVHGLDLFYTRVTPSKTFDMLKEDFDHWLIVMVLVGLVVASYVTKQLASRKALKQAWK